MPWDPARDLLAMQGRIESLFGEATLGWVPAVDLHELQDRYVVTIEVPGLSRGDLQIEFRDDALLVSGERPGLGCSDQYQQLERGHGAFSRSFRFSQPVNSEAVTADLADGVLTVNVPKAQSSGRRIEVE